MPRNSLMMLNRIYMSYQQECIKSPKYFIEHIYKSNYCEYKLLIKYNNMPYILNGQFIPKTEAQNMPCVDLVYITEVEPFTLIMNDMNSTFPSGNTVHWAIVNITTNGEKYKDNELLNCITFQNKQLYGRIIPLLNPPEYGGDIVYYISPMPSLNSGYHNYAFTLYNQSNGEIKFVGPIPIQESMSILFYQLGIIPSNFIASLHFISSYYPV